MPANVYSKRSAPAVTATGALLLTKSELVITAPTMARGAKANVFTPMRAGNW